MLCLWGAIPYGSGWCYDMSSWLAECIIGTSTGPWQYAPLVVWWSRVCQACSEESHSYCSAGMYLISLFCDMLAYVVGFIIDAPASPPSYRTIWWSWWIKGPSESTPCTGLFKMWLWHCDSWDVVLLVPTCRYMYMHYVFSTSMQSQIHIITRVM